MKFNMNTIYTYGQKSESEKNFFRRHHVLNENLKGHMTNAFRSQYQQTDFYNTIKNCCTILENFQNALKDAIEAENKKAGRTLTKREALKRYDYTQDEKVYSVLMQGTQAVFYLRSLLTDESLDFVLGGSNDNSILKEAIIPQKEIFGNSLGDVKGNMFEIKRGLVQLNKSLESYENLNQVSQSLEVFWKQLRECAIIKHYKTENGGEIEAEQIGKSQKRKKKTIVYYKKREKDTNVIARWTTDHQSGRHILSHYYVKDGVGSIKNSNIVATRANGYLFYNEGWLYQWVKTMQIKNRANGTPFVFPSGEHPVGDILKGNHLENQPGIRGGDYLRFQMKYGNQTVISLTNLYNIIGGSSQSSYNGLLVNLKRVRDMATGKEFQLGMRNLIADFTTLNGKDLDDFVNQKIDSLCKEMQKKS